MNTWTAYFQMYFFFRFWFYILLKFLSRNVVVDCFLWFSCYTMSSKNLGQFFIWQIYNIFMWSKGRKHKYHLVLFVYLFIYSSFFYKKKYISGCLVTKFNGKIFSVHQRSKSTVYKFFNTWCWNRRKYFWLFFSFSFTRNPSNFSRFMSSLSQWKNSNAEKVELKNLSFEASGNYRCEVSLESPIYTKESDEEVMNVISKYYKNSFYILWKKIGTCAQKHSTSWEYISNLLLYSV